ncbi:MAG: PAS domain S-box protein [Actinobacteria bacterium]|nr:PAS domain S-box protein [Actinomycetota bacterium]
MKKLHQDTRLELFDLESSLPLLERFVEFVPDAVIGVRERGMIAFANTRAEQLFGYSSGELTGRSVETLVPERQRPTHREHRAEYHETPRLRRMGEGLNLHGLRADGSEFPADISLSVVESGYSTLVLTFIRDLSDLLPALDVELDANADDGNGHPTRSAPDPTADPHRRSQNQNPSPRRSP